MKKRILSLILIFALLLSVPAWGAQWENPYKDVREGQWFYEGVSYVTRAGLFLGVEPDRFAPNASMTRAMLVTVLWRHSGCPAGETKNRFTDVGNDLWYTKPILWAQEKKIVSGVAPDRFNPNGKITREQLAAILCRYGAALGLPTEADTSLEAYPDSDRVQGYAVPSIRWAVDRGILTGIPRDGDIWLMPQGTATRAQVATMLQRFMGLLSNPDPDPDPNPNPDPNPDPDPQQPDEALTIRTGTVYATLGESSEVLKARLGEPREILMAFEDGMMWQIYGSDTYEDFLAVGIFENRAVMLCGAGSGFSCQGYRAGDTVPDHWLKAPSRACTDQNDENRLYMVILQEEGWTPDLLFSREASAGEEKLSFHLANAFRRQHGSPVLTWCPMAARAALIHSEDMKAHGKLTHWGSDGSKLDERMEKEGVRWRACGENIAMGSAMDALAAHDLWVNSPGHRKNMLNPVYEYLGTGFCGTGTVWATQDYYQEF